MLSKHYDLSNALKRDQVIWVNAYKEKSDVGEILETKTTLNKILARFLYKFAFKPNMTTNFITQDLDVPLTLTRLKPQSFFEQAPSIADKEEMSQFRNFLGHRSMKEVKAFPLHEYTARIHSLHNKMVLLKSLIHYGSVDAIKSNIDSDAFSYKNLFNNELPYFKDNQYCFGSLEGISTRPKDLCLRVLQSDYGDESSRELNTEL